MDDGGALSGHHDRRPSPLEGERGDAEQMEGEKGKRERAGR